jgi:hypothetical protein
MLTALYLYKTTSSGISVGTLKQGCTFFNMQTLAQKDHGIIKNTHGYF